MNRDYAAEALNLVHLRLLKAGAGMVLSWLGDGHRPNLTATLPIDGRDEPAAMALAMDAGVVNLHSRGGTVSGVAVVDDTWSPKPIDVRVQVNYGKPQRPGVPVIPTPRTGEVEVLDPDDLAHDRDDEIRDRRLDDVLLHGVEQ